MDRAFSRLINAVVNGETAEVSRMLKASPELATAHADQGASRLGPTGFFFERISHYLYAGDTALHMAAAAFERPIAALLVDRGATCGARNRRGAEPLHYAADTNRWKPAAQRSTIDYLLAAGADPNARDKSGVTALHRAVRTRSADAVQTLLAGGAGVNLPNKQGSTPLHLAVQDTGRGGAGLPRARDEQVKIVAVLIDAGAQLNARDHTGKTPLDRVRDARIRTLLEGARSS
jgi:ankyrin repeat protein